MDLAGPQAPSTETNRPSASVLSLALFVYGLTNPFVGRGSGGFTARGACDYLPQADFVTARSVGATWLSALPFILAERRGGVAAAQELFAEFLAERPIDVATWRARVSADCQLFLSTG